MFFYTYILKSLKDGKKYTGFTKNLKLRFEQHNEGLSQSTKSRRPFKLIYYEACLNKEDAMKREKYFKTHFGKMFIKNRLKSYLTGGFTILLSVLVTSIVLSVGLGIVGIMAKELKLSGVGRESQIAFSAADAGVECFFYWEIKHPNLADSAFDISANNINSVVCGGNNGVSNTNFTSDTGINSFYLTLGSDPDKKCAKVKVTKSGLTTTVESRGYNTTCDSTSPFKVERAIQLVSTKQEGGGSYLPPVPPINIVANSNSFHKVNLSWSHAGADSYTVYRSEDNKNFIVAASGITSQTYTDGGLDKDTDYYYYVTAIGAYGESDPSETGNAKTKDTTALTFTYKNSSESWSVLPGVQEVRISAYGAQGGGGSGGSGGYTSAIFNVNPSDMLYVRAGGAGAVSGSCGNNLISAGGFNGGGASGSSDYSGGACPGTGGGGASDVRKGVDSLNNRIIVAGGGGGGGGSGASGGGKGGAGGGVKGLDAVNTINTGGKEGTLSSFGIGGDGNHNGNLGNNGSLTGIGGAGGSTNNDDGGSGGGGGGGYYGGGGGGGGGDCNGSCASYGGGGGGGGSNYISGLYPKNQNGLNSGNGRVIIEY